MFDDDLRQVAVAVEKYFSLHRHMAFCRARIDYLTARIWTTEAIRNGVEVKRKGAFTSTIGKLYQDPDLSFPPSRETVLELTSSQTPFNSMRKAGEALDLMKNLREEYNTAKKTRDYLKNDVIEKFKNLHHSSGMAYSEILDHISYPELTYSILRNWLYGGGKNQYQPKKTKILQEDNTINKNNL